MAWGNPEQLKAEQQLVDRFNQENPDLMVRLFTVPSSNYVPKATLMLASGTAPDVMRIDHYVFPSLQPKGYFHDLTEFVKKDKTFSESDFYPTAMAECKVGDRYFALNTLFGGIVMYYNRTLLEAAHLEDPYQLFLKNEWTIPKYREYAKVLTKFDKEGEPKQFGTLVPDATGRFVFVWNFGGDYLSPDMKHSVVDSPQTVAAFQFLSDLVWKDHVAPTPAQKDNSAFVFEGGRVGMVFDFMGMSPKYRASAKGFVWDICPPPRGEKPLVTVIKGNQLVMASSCKHPDAAWRFMRFYTGYEAEIQLDAVIRRCFPSRKAVAASKEFLDGHLPPAHPEAFTKSVEAGRILPINPRWSEWTMILTAETDNLMSGREPDAGTALRRAKRKIDETLAEDPGF